MEIAMNQNILKSPNDKNLYRALVLQNELKVLLIQAHVDQNSNLVKEHEKHARSDSESCDSELSTSTTEDENVLKSEEEITDDEDTMPLKKGKKSKSSNEIKMAAAALCIDVGYFSDPPELPGLAHFLEHMIFMGSEKYPEENHYDSFVSEHGGSDNAYTSCEKTLFHMSITPQKFKEALDIFSNCFKSPLLKVDSMDREVESVDSEFQMCSASDSERTDYILSSTAKIDHPMTKFNCGNKDTLKHIPATKNIDVNAELHKFRTRYYSANHMTLAVQSTESLDTLENWVTEMFSDIPNNGLPPPSHENFLDPFKTGEFLKIYKVIPIKTVDKLLITWALPPLISHYKSKPLYYLSFLIGHEAKGSILSALKKRCWATNLVAGNDGNDYQLNGSGSLFSIIIELTNEGLDHVYDVATMIFQYVNMLQKQGPQERIFKENEITASNGFRFQEQEEADDYVESIALEMHTYPVEHYLAGGKLFFEYKPQVISKCLELMKPDLANIMILSSQIKESECTNVEKWSKCKYRVDDVPEEWLHNWKNLSDNTELHLPEPNIYLPTDFELKKHDYPESKYPRKLLEDDIGSVWFKEDRKFKIPKGYIQCFFSSTMMTESAKNACMLDLFNHIFINILTEDVYQALVADMQYSSVQSTDGILIFVGGFNHKLFLLLETIIDHITAFDPSEKQFQSYKKNLLRYYYNAVIKPNKFALNLYITLLRHTSWLAMEKREALLSVTKPMLIDYVRKAFSSFHLQCYYHGNFLEEEVLSMDKIIKEKLKPSPHTGELFSNIRITKLPDQKLVCRVKAFSYENINSYIFNHYQFGDYDNKSSCYMSLFLHFMSEPCFDMLRTQEQLGYEVYSIKTVMWGTFGIDICVQSPSNKFSSSYVDSRIENFLAGFISQMKEMDEADFEKTKASYINTQKCDDLNMVEEVRRFWNELRFHYYVFDRKEREIECLEGISYNDFRTWIAEEFENAVMKKKRKLSIQVVGQCDEIVKKRLKTPAESGEGDCIQMNDEMILPADKVTDTVYLTEPLINEEDFKFISNVNDFRNSRPFYTPNHISP